MLMDSLLQSSEPRAHYVLELLRHGLRGRLVQLIAVDDIGRVAAEAVIEDRPERPGLRGIELAGDELSYKQIIENFFACNVAPTKGGLPPHDRHSPSGAQALFQLPLDGQARMALRSERPARRAALATDI